jgi:hypothetical protein
LPALATPQNPALHASSKKNVIMELLSGIVHPVLVETSLPVSIPAASFKTSFTYQIISSLGHILRKGCFQGTDIYISTRLLPKGEQFLLRINGDAGVIHESRFKTI